MYASMFRALPTDDDEAITCRAFRALHVLYLARPRFDVGRATAAAASAAVITAPTATAAAVVAASAATTIAAVQTAAVTFASGSAFSKRTVDAGASPTSSTTAAVLATRATMSLIAATTTAAIVAAVSTVSVGARTRYAAASCATVAAILSEAATAACDDDAVHQMVAAFTNVGCAAAAIALSIVIVTARTAAVVTGVQTLGLASNENGEPLSWDDRYHGNDAACEAASRCVVFPSARCTERNNGNPPNARRYAEKLLGAGKAESMICHCLRRNRAWHDTHGLRSAAPREHCGSGAAKKRVAAKT